MEPARYFRVAYRGRAAKTSVTQPALYVVEHALARLWMSWGIEPSAMIGHSVGEYVAATLADIVIIGATGLVGHSILEVLARTFYALHDTKTPVLVGVAAIVGLDFRSSDATALLQMALVAVGYADTRNISPNTTAEGRAQNRRIQFQVK